MPRVDDDGNFSGSYLMYQSACYYYKPVKLMEEKALDCNDEDYMAENEKNERYVYNNNLKGRFVEG